MTTRTGVVTLRPATAADLDAIAEIEQAAFADPWSRASFASLVHDGRATFLVAHPEGDPRTVAGYVVAWFVADEGEIANLAISAASRRQGIASTLLREVLARAAARDVSNVYLEVRDSNVGARQLYAAHGFEEVGRRKAYYRRPVEDALVLRRAMRPA